MNPAVLDQLADGIEAQDLLEGSGLETLPLDRTRRGLQASRQTRALKDAKQSADHDVPAGSELLDRAIRALNTIDMLASLPDGHVMTEQAAQAILDHTGALRAVLNDVIQRAGASPEKPGEKSDSSAEPKND